VWLRLAPAASSLEASGFEQNRYRGCSRGNGVNEKGHKGTSADQTVRNGSRKRVRVGGKGEGENKKTRKDEKGCERLLCSIDSNGKGVSSAAR